MAQTTRMTYDSGERLLRSAVDIFRALVSLRRDMESDDPVDPPLPADILSYLPFRLIAVIDGPQGRITFHSADNAPSYTATWDTGIRLAKAS